MPHPLVAHLRAPQRYSSVPAALSLLLAVLTASAAYAGAAALLVAFLAFVAASLIALDWFRNHRQAQILEAIQGLMQSTHPAVLLCDQDGQILWGNPAALQVLPRALHQNLDTLLGHRLEALLQPTPQFVNLRHHHFRIQAVASHHGFALVELADITDSQRLQERLTQTLYALDQSAIVAQTDAHGAITFVNDKFCEISGYTREELLGADHRLVNSGYHPPAFFENLYSTIKAGNVWRGEIRNRAKDGRIYWVATTITPSRDPSGAIASYTAVRFEITARKEAEQRLAESNAWQAAILDSSAAAIITTNSDGIIRTLNKGAEQMLGYTTAEVAGIHHPGLFLDNAEVDARAAELEQATGHKLPDGFSYFTHRALQGLPDINEWWYVRKDGKRLRVLVSITALKSDEGAFLGLIGMAIDITPLKDAQQQALDAATRLETFVEHAPAAVAMFDNDLRYLLASRRWRSEYLPAESLAGESLKHTFQESAEPFQQWLSANGQRRSVASREDLFTPQHGQPHWLRWEAHPWNIAPNQPGGWLLAMENVTVSGRAQREFLANISHELRTPLNGILGFSHLLAASPLAPEDTQAVNSIRDSAHSLLQLVNNLLDFSHLESGTVTIQAVPCHLRQVAERTVSEQVRGLAHKPVTIHLDWDPGTPDFTLSDPTRFGQLLGQLLDNAVKFTAAGSITIRAFRDYMDRLRIEVRDTGVGVPIHRQHSIFDKFVQADGSATRQHGGAGLGLAMCRQIVSALGGEIGMHSRAGEGSTFWFAIPAPPPPETPRQPQAPPAEQLRILVAEDNPINQRLLLRLLEKLACQVDLVPNGQQAVDAAISQRYDLVLMDCSMPVLDGFSASRILRAAGIDTPIIAVTASLGPNDRERCRDAGMDDCIAKPVSMEDLPTLLDRWCPAASAQPLPQD